MFIHTDWCFIRRKWRKCKTLSATLMSFLLNNLLGFDIKCFNSWWMCGQVVSGWFLPSPSLRSSSCVSSGWFWRWRRSPPPAVAEPCGSAAEGWRRSPAPAEGSGSSCRSPWRSQKSRARTDSQLSPVGRHEFKVKGHVIATHGRNAFRSEGTGWSVCSSEELSVQTCNFLSSEASENSGCCSHDR